MEDIKENLINELADASVSGEGAKKDSEGSDFNKATGTLIASNLSFIFKSYFRRRFLQRVF